MVKPERNGCLAERRHSRRPGTIRHGADPSALRGLDASRSSSFDALVTPRASAGHELELMTGLLAEIACLANETELIIDDVERLPKATHALIQYLFLNAPANFRLIIGSRKPLPLETTELAAKGYLATLSGEDLRLRLEESLEILGKRLGRRVDVNDQAHLHEITQAVRSDCNTVTEEKRGSSAGAAPLLCRIL